MKNLNFIFDLLLLPFIFLISCLNSIKSRWVIFHIEGNINTIQKENTFIVKKKAIRKIFLYFIIGNTLLFASNRPDIGIDPTSITIDVDDNITLFYVVADEAPNTNNIIISYYNGCQSTNGSVTLSQGLTSTSFPIDTRGLADGDTCTIELTSAIGQGLSNTLQRVGSLSPTESIVTISSSGGGGTTPPPSNGIQGLQVFKTAAYTHADYNETIRYYVSATNESETTDITDINITDFPQIGDISNIVIEDTGDFNSCDFNVTIHNAIFCDGLNLDKVRLLGGGRRIVDFTTIIYTLKAPSYDATLINTVSVDGTNDVGTEHKEANATVFVGEGGGGGIFIPIAQHVDAIDHFTIPGTDYISGDEKVLKTMVASNNRRSITALHLDGGGVPTLYSSSDAVLQMIVIPYLSNGSCTTQEVLYDADYPDRPLIITIPGGSYSDTGDMIVPSHVQKDSRIYLTYVDLEDLYSLSGDNCLKDVLNADGTISDTGNLPGLSQCVNAAEQHYRPAFGQSAYDRCIIGNGQPCESSHNGSSCGKFVHGSTAGCPDFNPIYDNSYGCLMCTLNIAPDCSSDNFAIRPKNFDVNIANGDTFIAGEPEALLFRAPDDNNIIPSGPPPYNYNETQNTSFVIDLNVSDPDGCEVKNLTISPLVNFVDGIHQDNFSFNDVGDINMSIHEVNGTEFALVDADDTNDTLRFIEEFNVTIRVIPDHFNIDANLTNHNTDNNFTYLHDINITNDRSMAAVLTIDIQAMGADNNITKNYMETCYAKETNLTLVLNSTDITYSSSDPALEQFLYYNPVEDNGSTDSGEGNYSLTPLTDITNRTISIPSLPIENIKSTFPADAPDGNGTTHIEYQLNFDRKQNLVVNPFKIDLSDVNIIDTDDVNGSVNVDQNATMYYARTRASMFFYEDITDNNVTTPILVDIFCNLGYAACDALGIDTVNGEIDDLDWWISMYHNETTQDDGNITLIINLPGAIIEGETTDTPTVDTDVTINTQGKDDTIVVTSNASKLPMTVIIDLDETNPTDTNRWLIYNPDNEFIAPSPFYKIRFIGDANWTGEGQTGYVMDINASYIKLQRLDW